MGNNRLQAATTVTVMAVNLALWNTQTTYYTHHNSHIHTPLIIPISLAYTPNC